VRDDFTEVVKKTIAARVNYRCSRPDCAAPTSGPHVDPTKSLNIGVAAHITAASPGGPRYNPILTSDERKSANNAIWLCQNCGKLIDNDESRFTEVQIRQWKQRTEAEALIRIGKTAAQADPEQSDWSVEELIILIASAGNGEIFIHSTDETGSFIEAGRQHFFDMSDPSFAALYLDAFEQLCRRGLVRHEGGRLYVLNGKGFQIARALKQKESEAEQAASFAEETLRYKRARERWLGTEEGVRATRRELSILFRDLDQRSQKLNPETREFHITFTLASEWQCSLFDHINRYGISLTWNQRFANNLKEAKLTFLLFKGRGTSDLADILSTVYYDPDLDKNLRAGWRGRRGAKEFVTSNKLADTCLKCLFDHIARQKD
jgi:hypothetical protein